MAQQSSFATRGRGTGLVDGGGPPMGTNRFAGWARVCGLLALVPFALVFGVIGLVQVRRSGQRGKGAAITGLVAAMVWALFLLNLAAVVDPQVQRGRDGGVAKTQADSVFDLRPGDCFNARSKEADGGIRWVLLVPCSQSHEGRVYATPTLSRDEINPGDAAKAACAKALPTSTPAGASFGYIYPSVMEFSQGRGKASCFLGS